MVKITRVNIKDNVLLNLLYAQFTLFSTLDNISRCWTSVTSLAENCLIHLVVFKPYTFGIDIFDEKVKITIVD